MRRDSRWRVRGQLRSVKSCAQQRGQCSKGAECPMAHEEVEGARPKRPGASGLGLREGRGHANMTLYHDKTLNNPSDNNSAINAVLTLNDDLTKNKCCRSILEGANRSEGSKLTLIDPKSNNLSIHLSSNNHKVLIGSNPFHTDDGSEFKGEFEDMIRKQNSKHIICPS